MKLLFIEDDDTAENEKGNSKHSKHMNTNETITSGNKKVLFTGFTDHTIPGSIKKYFLRFADCSSSERQTVEGNLKKKGAQLMGINGHNELALIFPSSWEISNSCGEYLESVAFEIECPPGCSLEQLASILLAHRA
jgi:hypothetical protein